MRHAALLISLIAILVVPSAVRSAGPAGPPVGATGIALDASAQVSWQPVAGASGYTVYRGTSAASITTLVTPPAGVAATSFNDTSAANGTTYYYAVRAIVDGIESTNSGTVQIRPIVRACSTGNAVVLENCYAGNTGWNVRETATIAAGGIEGFGTASSINKGQSVDLKVNADDSASFRIEIYRTGYYGGSGARLLSTVRGVPAVRQPGCVRDTTTGLADCSNWSPSATITTTSAWPSGVYLLRLVREDTGTDFHVLLTVRDDSRNSDVLYGTTDSNYQAYNNYGGKSLYDFNSTGNTTAAGTPRAVEVSFDRPYEQPRSGLRDWYTRTDIATVTWLEREGYDVAYQSNVDLELNPSLVLNHDAYISPSHDEYYSAGMRSALEAARAAGVNLFFTGSNEVYWKIRFKDSSVTGATKRVQVGYKSTQTGGPDPSGIHTGTWRDPAGANNPENALTGVMYVGDADNTYFPLRVSATEGSDRIWRNTGLETQAPGTFTNIGSTLVGWEWDARAANGFEPAGVKTLASSPATGQLVQEHGRSYIPGSTVTTMVKYTAPSGALVVTTATNHWNRGLARNAEGVGEPEVRIQQATTNILADMEACPSTPAADIVLDNCSTVPRPPAPTSVAAGSLGTDSIRITWNAVAGVNGYNVYRALAPRDGGQPLGTLTNGTLVTGTSFTDIGLNSATAYYYVVTAVSGGVQSLASNESSATTTAAAGQPTRINTGGADFTAVSGAFFRADTFFTGGSTFSDPTRAITGTSDPALYRNERWGNFTYAVPVAAGTYDVRLHFVELYYGTAVPGGVGSRVFSMDVLDTAVNPDIPNLDIFAQVGKNAALVRTISNVVVSDGTLNVRSIYGAADDPELAAIEIIPVSTAPSAPTVTDTLPLAGATGVSRLAHPTATFSRSMDASTITSSSFTLRRTGGALVPATVGYDSPSLTATLVPTAQLDFSTSYTARIETTVKAADGNALASAVTWSFTTQAPVAPEVTSTFPIAGVDNVSPSARPRAVFSRSLDPATVTASSFTLQRPDGSTVPATVSYDDSTRTATLTPTGDLAFSTLYTARLTTAITAVDGVPLAAPHSWSFTTATAPPPAPTVTARTPAEGATGVTRASDVTATFSRDMDASTITASSFTLGASGTPVPATVTYDATSRTARLVPNATLAYSTVYTATLSTTVHASDGAALAGDVTWQFTTESAPPPPAVTSFSPADGAAYVARNATVQATFSRAMNASTITSSSFTLRRPNGSSVSALVSYDAGTRTATLTPTALLDGATAHTATLDSTILAADGVALTPAVSFSFSTAACPCSLFSSVLVPSTTGLSTQDGRTGAGPWSYELGVKFTVDQPMLLSAVRFWKSPGETGVHTGRLWTAGGLQLASVTFTGESASGWQQQALSTPASLQPNAVYVLSVNANAFFVSTRDGLASQIASGPLRTVADGLNGVYGASAGTFPTQSWSSTNYFVDLQAVLDGETPPPTVTGSSPAAGATDVARTAPVTATFSRPMDAASLTTSSFTLRRADGSLVPASIAYDGTLARATLTPSAPLAYSATYTATVTTAARATDGRSLAAPVSWSFTVIPPVPPQVTATVPADGSAESGTSIRPKATFSKALIASTVNASTFTLSSPSGSVSASVTYDPATLTATLAPAAPLAEGSYTARLDGSITAADDAQLGTAYTWSFGVIAPPPPLAVSNHTPAAGAIGVARTSGVTATFSRAIDPATLSSSSFGLRAADGSSVASAISYDPATRVATLTPNAILAPAATYTARVETAVTAADGTPLAAASAWSFTTSACPCTLFSPTLTPVSQNLDTRDGRPLPGPWSYEFGVKTQVDQAMSLTAIRFYKSSQETGTHVGRVWTANGTLLMQVTFAAETASGWQQQALATPLALAANTTYVVSVNANSRFVATTSGLLTQVVSGPVHTVADGQNGVFGSAAGVFPNQSYSSSNYFVDLAVVPQGDPTPLGVASTMPATGATEVARTAVVGAVFTKPVSQATLTSANFTLTGPGGAVAGSIAYNAASREATLTPSSPLAYGTTYTARLTTDVRGTDGNALSAPVVWSFTTVSAVAPQVTSTFPAAGASSIEPAAQPRATFSKPMNASSLNGSTFTLTGPAGAVAGAVAYDAATQTATFTPSAALANGAYTARVDGSVSSADDVPLGTAHSWSFTVSTQPSLAVTSTVPASGATSVSRDTVVVRATFNRSVNPATLTPTSFRLLGADGSAVAATITWDAATLTASLTPGSALAPLAQYTAELSTEVRATDGSALSPAVSWSFTTSACPCQLFSPTLAPASTNLQVRDGRPLPGPWTYELGVKIQVTQASSLFAVRYYKASKETGSHTARIWSTTGTLLASVTFIGESGAGWQQQTLATPVALAANTTYVVSVNANARYSTTTGGLATQVVSGPLRSVADGQNGVFGASAGTFPTQSFNSSNYFVDAVVR